MDDLQDLAGSRTTRHVVGLDLSLRSTGIAIGDRVETISFPMHNGPERLAFIRDEIATRIVYEAELEDPLIVIEGYSYASHQAAYSLGELGGVMRVFFWEGGWPYVEVPPKVRAKFATGKGNAGKSEVISAVSARTGKVWSGGGADDLCDAWVLQEMGLARLNRARYDWPQSHRAALKKVDWGPWEQYFLNTIHELTKDMDD